MKKPGRHDRAFPGMDARQAQGHVAMGGGESFDDITKRFVPFIQSLVTETQGQRAVSCWSVMVGCCIPCCPCCLRTSRMNLPAAVS